MHCTGDILSALSALMLDPETCLVPQGEAHALAQSTPATAALVKVWTQHQPKRKKEKNRNMQKKAKRKKRKENRK